MTPVTPYLIRAYYQWMEDSGLTAHILVDCRHSAVVVPKQFIQQDKIVLNITSSATQSLVLGDNHISFKARFSGQSMDVYIPSHAILSIYAGENGEGMQFEPQDPESEDKQKPGLTLLD
ncbi:ClpXP protease specificity-enhancing factor [Candidatus Thioglobus sp.]|jgi:stringent starvation protein B|uniref:ClpXP protease specificity-enhancing factor n=1 Tax=Candidatus Thioglobus sp. TaxID=2026721 RepID=UPI001D45A438|nr:ClpXP protease specificity-enhancing factor [Candidatus Thioglobus sp.]MBT3276448.1 ClpXP protease specificity-enhancing factor [Candidatus Thioglobus sp.]MBT3446716.1 ClpXP protease specificity-enhancing factor [Candidatus Thioglobus sp.]MBT3745297.1 ClpXP protease specificity-enhancing factor [Candidatus Thioglobus sp.]MBT4001011.1 ClpXP protease specificity-enhancing factor [Candidatus Thioglobus sp.]MBT4181621.1 ClpXP protease specificity-enhancing factor [Candidatus Thioglobus sp.]